MRDFWQPDLQIVTIKWQIECNCPLDWHTQCFVIWFLHRCNSSQVPCYHNWWYWESLAESLKGSRLLYNRPMGTFVGDGRFSLPELKTELNSGMDSEEIKTQYSETSVIIVLKIVTKSKSCEEGHNKVLLHTHTHTLWKGTLLISMKIKNILTRSRYIYVHAHSLTVTKPVTVSGRWYLLKIHHCFLFFFVLSSH